MSKNGSLFLKTSFSIFLMILMSVGSTNVIQAQSFDHEPYPQLDFDFLNLELDLGIQPQNLRIDGAAIYHIEANISGADTLILYASHIDVSSVSVDEAAVDFSLSNDSLFIPVDDSATAGQQYNVNIRYSGSPQFGLLKNFNGTVWTSQLPKTQRHWVPIIDNPRVQFKTTFNIVVPSGVTVWATGQKTGEEAVSVDVMRYQFTSEKPVPASSLAFALGGFDNQSANLNDTNINLAVESFLSDSVDSRQLLDSAVHYLEEVENQLKLEYPFDQLDIILMTDHYWETKAWGGGTVYLYQNRGNLHVQLLRGIIAQWFGVYQREAQWSQADAINLYQTLLANNLNADSLKLLTEDTPETEANSVYHNFSAARWNQWQMNINNWQNASVRSQIESLASRTLKELPVVINWNDYANLWYRDFGQPLLHIPDFSVTENGNPSEQTPDSVAYDVIYSLNEAEGTLKLRFESTYGSYAELTTLPVYEIYPGRIDTAEVTFTGAQDSIILQVDPMIQTFRLGTSGYPELVLDEYKPASFLLEELRMGETVAQRVKAAEKLGYHEENADLQLAIHDFIQTEPDPKVKAALLSSMADITQGASGTEQMFLDALQSENQDVRNAALMALQNYENNVSVLNRVKSAAQNADDFKLFKKATEVLTTIASQEQFAAFVETITQQDPVGNRAVFAIQQLANMGNVDEAVQRASLFTGEQFRYEIRRRALEILIQHDHAPDNWLSRAEELLEDADPRIRFLTVEGLERNQNEEVRSYLSEQILDEYDARVHQRMERVISNE